MRSLAAVLAIVVFACGGAATPGTTVAATSGSVTVFAASSLTEALTKASDDLKARYPATNYVLNFGSSSTLATQITNGAPVDVFASADETTMQRVVDAKLNDGMSSIFATNRLAIAVRPGNPLNIASLADLARAGLVVVLAAPTVPVGKYTLDALAKAGVKLTAASQELDARAVLNKVALGEADAGIVYATDVLSAGARVSGVDIPEQQQVVARYPVVVVSGTRNPTLARAFVDYLVSDEGQRLLAGFGFSRP